MDYLNFRKYHSDVLSFIRDTSDFILFVRNIPLSETQCVILSGYVKKSIDMLEELSVSLEKRTKELRNAKKVI